MTCDFAPVIYPPPCLVPPCPPVPPPGGDQCLRVMYACDCPAGVSTWALTFFDCAPNAACSGAQSCSPLSFYLEVLDGCFSGTPLYMPNPLAVDPPCLPDCCPPADCCLKMQWHCQCSSGSSFWVPDANYPKCIDNNQCGSSYATGDGNAYTRTQLNGCTCNATPSLPARWTPATTSPSAVRRPAGTPTRRRAPVARGPWSTPRTAVSALAHRIPTGSGPDARARTRCADSSASPPHRTGFLNLAA
jgi:hypothetical protein